MTWQIVEGEAKDYSDFVRHTWEYCYDTYSPKPVDTPYSIEYMKQTLSQFFVSSFVDKYPLVYNSGIHLRTDACTSNGQAEVGFIGRVLLNAFNAWEYGWECNREDLKANSTKVFDSYLKNGFTEAGFSRNRLILIRILKILFIASVVSQKGFMQSSISWLMKKKKDVNIRNGNND